MALAFLVVRPSRGYWGIDRGGDRRLRMEVAHGEPEAAHRRGHWSFLGIRGAYLFALVIRNSIPEGHTQSFLQILVMLLMAYVGLIVGANKGDLLNLAALGGIFGGEKQGKKSYKILDTSVIIDGRIADIAETGFLDGIIVTPQFVLRELQLVADSADSFELAP